MTLLQDMDSNVMLFYNQVFIVKTVIMIQVTIIKG